MQLAVPGAYVHPESAVQRPPLNVLLAAVRASASETEDEWPLYIRLRLTGYDLATRASDAPAEVGAARLILRQDGTVRRFPVQLAAVSGPVPAWRVTYEEGRPDFWDARREWRNGRDTLSGLVGRRDSPVQVPTTSYDFSLSAIRFFVPWPLEAHDRIPVRWRLDHDWIDGIMVVIRRESAVTWWNSQPGYRVVGQWEDLDPEAQRRWRTYCWRHQPDHHG